MSAIDSRFADLRLTADELAELTERVLEQGSLARAEPALIPLGTCLEILSAQQVPLAHFESAVDELVRRRDCRLSSAIERKAHDLERMLHALLPRIDVAYHSEVDLPIPSSRGTRTGSADRIRFLVAAERGRMDLHARRISVEGTLTLFTIRVEASRAAPWWARLLRRSESGVRPRRVAVIDPWGVSLAELLARTLARSGPDPRLARAWAFAFESLAAVLHGEVDTAVRFVNDLAFDARDDAGG